MSVMDNAFRNAVGITGKTFTGIIDFVKGRFEGIKAGMDDAAYVQSLKTAEKKAGRMDEVHRQARAFIQERDNDHDLLPSFNSAVVHVLRKRDQQRQATLTATIRGLEYHK